MKLCKHCGSTLTVDAKFCYACNTPQTEGFDEFDPKPKYNDTFLKILCIITIVGASFSLITGTVSSITGSGLKIEGMEFVGYTSLAIAIVKLGSAIMMLKKKRIGLYVYTAVAIIGIFLQIYSVFLTSDYMEVIMQDAGTVINGGAIVMITTAIVVFFYVSFLIMYWLPVNRRLLS